MSRGDSLQEAPFLYKTGPNPLQDYLFVDKQGASSNKGRGVDQTNS